MLTYMATIPKLIALRELEEFDPDLGSRETQLRYVYARPKVVAWITEILPTVPKTVSDCDLNPAEQLDAMLKQFITNRSVAHWSSMHIMLPDEQGVWELKTADIRMFGWFPKKDHLIIGNIDSMERCKIFSGIASGYRDDTIRVRSALDLDPPKFIKGDIKDVLSNPF